MGWASANEIFDPVARKLIAMTDEQVVITEILAVLIHEMQQCNWDTEDESLKEFKDNPAIVEAFRRNKIIIQCGAGGEAGDWCWLERGHGGDFHEDYREERWPVQAQTP